MIDRDLLRRLGWQEDLIQEVTRVAEALREDTPALRTAASPQVHPFHISGNALFINSAPLTPPTVYIQQDLGPAPNPRS